MGVCRYFDEKEKRGIWLTEKPCFLWGTGEFIDYRFSFMHSILFVSESWFDIVIQSLKFLPLLAAALLTVVGLCKKTSK